MTPTVDPSPQPKRHLVRFSCFCTDDHRVSPYFTTGLPWPLKIAPSHGDLDAHLIHGSLGPPESSTQTASWSVQPFLQGSLVWQTDRQTDRLTDRQTDHATRSVTIGRIYVRSTAVSMYILLRYGVIIIKIISYCTATIQITLHYITYLVHHSHEWILHSINKTPSTFLHC